MAMYDGSIQINGNIKATSPGVQSSDNFSESLGIDLSATTDNSGNGDGSETLNTYGSYSSIDGLSVLSPTNFLTQSFAIQQGSFTLTEPLPSSLTGVNITLTVSGAINPDGQVSDTFLETISGTNNGTQYSGTVAGSGTLNLVIPPALDNFGADAGGWTSQNEYPREVADVTGNNGLSDIVGFGGAGVWVAANQGNGQLAQPTLALNAFGAAGGWTSQNIYPRELGDVTNSKGLADIVAFGAAGVFEAPNLGNGQFGQPSLALDAFGAVGGWINQNSYPRELADLTGNGLDDIVAFGAQGVYVSMNEGNGQFSQPQLVLDAFGEAGGWTSQDLYPRELADVNGDGKADIVAFGAQGVYVSMNEGNGQFAQPELVLGAFGAAGGWSSQNIFPRELADVSGDGMADIVGFGASGVYVAKATGNGNFAQPTFDLSGFGASSSGGGWTDNDTDPRLLGNVLQSGAANVVGFGSDGVFLAALPPT